MPRRRVALFTTVTLPVIVAAACSVETPNKVSVTATDTTCTASKHEAKSGEITFEATNNGSIFTEVYLYGPGDRVMNERENIDPGQTKDFKIDVGGGNYEIACKPGMVGDGIRTNFTVTGPPDPRLTEPVDRATYRGVEQFGVFYSAFDDHFDLRADLAVVTGQTVVFEMTNAGTVPHGFRVLDPAGAVVGEIPAVDPGQKATVPMKFTTLGTYSYIDPIGDNATKGLRGTFDVIT